MPDEEESYKIVHLDNKERKQIQELIKRLASEERIGIDEHIYKEKRCMIPSISRQDTCANRN